MIYSGTLGFLIYRHTIREKIPYDHLLQRGFRSVAHCYSGCGLGEIIGIMLAVGVFASSNVTTARITFSFAYLAAMAFTIGPLMQNGVDFPTKLKDALLS